MPLDTLANVKQALAVVGTGDDALLALLQAVADSYIDTHCGRNFAGGTFTELHPGGVKLIFLRNYPIAAVTEIRVDPLHDFGGETVADPDRYVVHSARGVVEHLDGSFVPMMFQWRAPTDDFPQAVRVTYTTATEAVPGPVCRAYAELIGHWYRQAKTYAATNQLNVSEVPGADGPAVYPWGQSYGYKIPPGVNEMLAPFRVPAF